MTQVLNQIFGITPQEETEDGNLPVHQVEETEVSAVDVSLQQAEDDFNEVRDNIKDMLNKSKAVFDTAHLVATSSQNSADIAGFAKIMDTIVKSSKELMGLHKDIFAIKPVLHEEPKQQAETINNIVFTGTPAEFLQYLKNRTKDNDSEST